jgi:hypothetical protein
MGFLSSCKRHKTSSTVPIDSSRDLAALEETDVATAMGFFSFLRSFGMVWGITVPGLDRPLQAVA